MKEKIAVIGGGILGMTAALRLKEKGHNVSLFEANESLGGLAAPWQIDNITWDKYYHVVLLSDQYTRKILSEIGLDHKVNWVETKTGFYSDRKLHSMSNLIEFFKFPPIGLIDKFRLGLTIFVASRIKNEHKLESILVEDWLRKWSGKNTFNKIWRPLLKAKLGESYKETAASFIWATIQRMYAARKTGLKKEMFGYAEGGYATIISEFEKLLLSKGVEIHTNHQVERIEKNDADFNVTFKNGSNQSFSKVISTLPSKITAGICPQLNATEKDKLRNVQYLGVVCTSILLRKSISEYYVTNITDSNNPFTGIIEMGALVDKKNFNGNSLIYLPKYVKASDPFFKKTDEEVEKIFLDALLRMYPSLSKDDIIAVKTARTANVFPLPILGYSKTLTPMKSSVDGFYIINSSFITNSTLNVNDTVKLAEEGLKEIE